MKSITVSILIGAALILFGLSIIVKVVFGIDIPLFRVFLAGLLIYWGICLITKPKEVQFGSNRTYVYTARTTDQEKFNKEYTIAFGGGKIDLTNIKESTLPVSIQVNVSFGQATILIDKNIPTAITAQSTFAHIQIADEDQDVNSVERFHTHPGMEEKVHLFVQAHFAQVTIVKI